MQTYTFRKAQENLSELFDDVVSTSEPAKITSIHGDVIVISKKHLDLLNAQIADLKDKAGIE